MKTFCRDCKFFVHTERFAGMGECRVEAPMVHHLAMVYGGVGYEGTWPVVQTSDWCGQFKRKPK